VRGQEAAFRACGRVLPFDRNPTAGKKQATWPYKMPAFGWDLSLYRDSRKFVIAIFLLLSNIATTTGHLIVFALSSQ
jgi:hypothetical protein